MEPVDGYVDEYHIPYGAVSEELATWIERSTWDVVREQVSSVRSQVGE